MRSAQQAISTQWSLGREKLGFRTYLLLFLFLAGWAFDFRASTRGQLGGSAVQVAYLVVCFGGGSLFCLLDKTRPPSKSLMFVTLAWILGMALQFICATAYPIIGLQETDWNIFLRQSLPYLNITISLCVIQSLIRQNISIRVVMRILAILLPLSCIFRAMYAILVSGFDIDTIRYQVQSGGLLFCLAYGLASIFFDDKFDIWGIFNLGTFIVISAISVTRTLFVVFGVCLVMSVILLLLIKFMGGKVNTLARVRQLGIVMLLGLVCAGTIIAIRPNTFSKWLNRNEANTVALPNGTSDQSLEIRYSQVRGEMTKFKSNPLFVIFGATFGGSYVPDSRYYVELNMAQAYNQPTYGGSDSGIVYTLFGGGLLFGGFILASVGIFMLGSLVGLLKIGAKNQFVYTPIMATVALFLVASSAYSLTGSILEDRYAAQILGVCMGIFLVLWDKLKQAEPVAVPAAASMPVPEPLGY